MSQYNPASQKKIPQLFIVKLFKKTITYIDQTTGKSWETGVTGVSEIIEYTTADKIAF